MTSRASSSTLELNHPCVSCAQVKYSPEVCVRILQPSTHADSLRPQHTPVGLVVFRKDRVVEKVCGTASHHPVTVSSSGRNAGSSSVECDSDSRGSASTMSASNASPGTGMCKTCKHTGLATLPLDAPVSWTPLLPTRVWLCVAMSVVCALVCGCAGWLQLPCVNYMPLPHHMCSYAHASTVFWLSVVVICLCVLVVVHSVWMTTFLTYVLCVPGYGVMRYYLSYAQCRQWAALHDSQVNSDHRGASHSPSRKPGNNDTSTLADRDPSDEKAARHSSVDARTQLVHGTQVGCLPDKSWRAGMFIAADSIRTVCVVEHIGYCGVQPQLVVVMKAPYTQTPTQTQAQTQTPTSTQTKTKKQTHPIIADKLIPLLDEGSVCVAALGDVRRAMWSQMRAS